MLTTLGESGVADARCGVQPFPWFGVRTRSNFEKISAKVLQNKGFAPFVPSYQSKRRWSDRVVISDTPLFPGYVFCRFDPAERRAILTSSGVVDIVGFGSEPAPIPDEEIEAIKTVLRSGLATEPCPFLRVGQRVRVIYGAMRGLEGILLKKKTDFRLVLSVPALMRSISVEIDREWIKPV